MKLVIDGITKLHFKTFYGRKISNIRVDNRGKGDGTDNAYVFTFPELSIALKSPNWKPNGMGKSWESSFEVWLSQYPNGRGKYEMFVMGLHGVTCYDVPMRELHTLDSFSVVMGVVVNRCKRYWETL
jgi:hypothetical protein